MEIKGSFSEPVIVDQGRIMTLQGKTMIGCGISFGACVLGIIPIDDIFYKVGHLQPGMIVDELTALAKKNGGRVVVHQHSVQGLVEELYENGRTYSLKDIKKFKDRDGRYGQ